MSGLSVAEFSIRNKPVLTYAAPKNDPSETFHLRALGPAAFKYNNEQDIVNVISSFVEKGIPPGQYDGYKQYLPGPTMKIFNDVFLRPVFENRLTEYHKIKQC